MSDDAEGDARRFTSLLGRVLKVSKEELKRREAEYKKQRDAERAERETPHTTEPTSRTP